MDAEEMRSEDGAGLRCRDYKARDVFHDILRDLLPNIGELELRSNADAYNALFLTGTRGRNGENRLVSVEGKDEAKSLTVWIFFFQDSKLRANPKGIKLKSWEEVYEYADEIRESVRNILRG